MTFQGKVVIANLVGILVLGLGMFGIDVAPEKQAQIIAGLGAIGCLINTVLVAFRSQPEKVADELASLQKHQRGFAQIEVLALLVLLAAGALMMSACAPMPVPETPRQAIGSVYSTIDSLADLAAIAYREGHITDTQRQQARQQLQEALTLAADVERTLLTGGTTGDQLERINELLRDTRSLIKQEARRDE